MKALALLLLFAGETLVIYAEEIGARTYAHSTGFFSAFVPTLIPLVVGAVFLVTSYMLGFKYFQNIWIVSAISFGSIILVEPLFDYFYIGQVPTLGAGIGMSFGLLGILSALFL